MKSGLGNHLAALLIGVARCTVLVAPINVACGSESEACSSTEVYNDYWGDCRAPASVSQRCGETADCEEGLTCQSEVVPGSFFSSEPFVADVCHQPAGAEGEPCGTHPQREPCVDGTECIWGGDDAGRRCWLDTGELYTFVVGEEDESVCVADGTRREGEQCNRDDNCKDGLVCNEAYEPAPRCEPPSALGGPCRLDKDCTEGTCTYHEADDDCDGTCIRADEDCDPRVDPDCDTWWECGICEETP